MTTSVLKKLRNKLPADGSTKIAEQTGFSIGYVNMVLNNDRKNQSIIDCAINVAQKHQADEKLKTDFIKSL